jgi:putative Mg2+ transporter-C (MgtC) family protein
MPLHVTWADLAVRIACALIAGAILGYNRGEHGKSAGMRTTILVCLAAAVAMLQMNYLLLLSGRPSDSFIMNDLMRLPLGILTGVGFIGGGAILRRGDLVVGVTTAATLWFVTVIGLCFGGGQVLLGSVATAVGGVVLWGLKWIEGFITVAHYAKLILTVHKDGLGESDIRRHLREDAIEIVEVRIDIKGELRTYTLNVRELRKPFDTTIPTVVETLARQRGVSAVQWSPFG